LQTYDIEYSNMQNNVVKVQTPLEFLLPRRISCISF